MTAKVPYPRQLTSNETLDTLTHWKSHVRNYFRRDDNMKVFFARAAKWDCSKNNYGFQGEDAADKADSLESLLDTIAGFMPGPYLTAQITKHTKGIEDVFKLIWKHYDVDPTPSTFLDFDSLSLDKEERYIDLFYRMLYHTEQHLVTAGTEVEGEKVNTTEQVTHSHKNLVALNWLQKINPNLVGIVRLEKSKDLKNGQQLHSLVHDISKNIDDWLVRHGKTKDGDNVVRNVRWDSSQRGTSRGRGSFRGRFRGSYNSRPGSNMFCPGCNYLSKELHLNVDFAHFPAQCPRKRSVLRLLKLEEANLDGEDNLDQPVEPEQDDDQDTSPEGKDLFSQNDNANVRKIWKAKSPELDAFIFDTKVKAIIDEGSEISAISSELQSKLKLPLSRTVELARTADLQNLTTRGETSDAIQLKVPTLQGFTLWSLGQCLVIDNLGCDVLVGEPAKVFNNICTNPSLKQATCIDQNKNVKVVPYSKNECNVFKVNIEKKSTVYPNEVFHLDVPEQFKNCKELVVESVEKSICPEPTIVNVKNGKVILKNNCNYAVSVDAENPLYFTSLKKIYDINSSSMKQFEAPCFPGNNNSFDLNQVKLDPDNILSDDWKNIFIDILSNFTDILTDKPGRYNGYYGQVPCSLTITGMLPPSVKPRLPNYPDEKLKIMANLMDKMEKWGVLVKPETIGVIPTHVHPCILVPKENGSFRLVTDFRSIQSNILQIPTIMPTVADAMKDLALSNFHIELDFSNYYWQNAIPREDSEKLAVVHPYGGLRVYTVLPQGLRNSAEWGSEILARIYGDLVKNKICTRIADQLYVLGDTLTEVTENFKEVLKRAQLAGLTFKPEKIVICPKSTVILGWKKINHEWFPTNHVLSPLAQAEPPSTIKKLRGWIGAYRQIAKTIPNHSSAIQVFEKMTGGKNSRDRINWSPELLVQFDKAKDSVKTAKPISFPRPSDSLQIYSDWSQDADAVGGRLLIIRKEKGEQVTLNGGEFSCRLKGAQSKWTPCEKECLAIKLLVQHFQPFIRENNNITTIFTDNIVTVHAWAAIQNGKISTSSRVASFVSTLCENKVNIVHIPGNQTILADYNSRHPSMCNETKCQICNFINQEIDDHDVIIRNVTQLESAPLAQRKAWLDLQKKDPTHVSLFKLIQNGQAPEKKSGNKSVKLLHNLYKRGVLNIAKDGLIQVKHPDLVHNIEYNAISVPETYISPLVQSLHMKLNHPSAYQLNKIMSRQYYCSGLATVIQQISTSCNTCIRLKTLPKEIRNHATSPSETFGKHFSADVLIEKGQKILLCREKLSQYTLTKIILDETADTLETALVSLIADLVPEDGTIVQVDAATGFQALENGKGKFLSKFKIELDIGRVTNKQKNPIAENAIKEFRKEWLRLKPNGDSLTEIDLVTITSIINNRIRSSGLAPKEIMLKRSKLNHESITVNDSSESQMQFERRKKHNDYTKLKDSLTLNKPATPEVKVGDLVYIKKDLSKSRGREEYIVTKIFVKNDEIFLLIRKTEKQFRNKDYLVKLSEIILAPSVNIKESDNCSENEEESFQGFQENITLNARNKLQEITNNIKDSLPTEKARGRPRISYPDYINQLSQDVVVDEEDEQLCGFDHEEVTESKQRREKLQTIIHEMEDYLSSDDDSDDFQGFTQTDLSAAKNKLTNLKKSIKKESNLRSVKNKTKISVEKYPWNQEEWRQILEEEDEFDVDIKLEISDLSTNLLKQLPNYDAMNLSIDDYFKENADSLTFDDTEFLSFNETGAISKTTFRSKSETDPNLLEKIPVVEESDSDIEFNENLEQTMITSSPIKWSPQKIKCDKVQNLDKVLESLNKNSPALQKPEEGRVYDMDEILSDIENHCEIRVSSRRTRRHDYKQANSKGFSFM